MEDHKEKIQLLNQKLDHLLKRQDAFNEEIADIQKEIRSLSLSAYGQQVVSSSAAISTKEKPVEKKQIPNAEIRPSLPNRTIEPKVKSDIEKFIGENLINKIGIAITVLGVGIGAKYSIEHQLISPLTRIILGYLMGFILLGLGIKLKQKYESYSAVLVSGAMAIMYFMTYIAYDFYALMPQLLAFGLMFVFTAFTVFAALQYNMQVIAHIGLVGAYAVPFLLSNGSGRVAVLFTYMLMVNLGVLVIAFKKYWKSLYYVAFSLTWLVFFSWYFSAYSVSTHFEIALLFLFLFFAVFYLMALVYKLWRKEKYESSDVVMLLVNSFVFYGVGYLIFDSNIQTSSFLGLFTLLNAVIHFMVCVLIYRQRLGDKNLFYLVAGLVLSFITIAIFVQFDGRWVTLLWVAEALLLFWIGRTKAVVSYEKLSYVVMLLSFLSFLHDLSILTGTLYIPTTNEKTFYPLLNISFLSSMVFMGALACINYIHHRKKAQSVFLQEARLEKTVSSLLAGTLLLVIYLVGRTEIIQYWAQLFSASYLNLTPKEAGEPNMMWNSDLLKLQSVSLFYYNLLFFGILSWVNIRSVKSRSLGLVSVLFSVLVLSVFLFNGSMLLSELRHSYINQTLSEYYEISVFHIAIRYFSYPLVAFILWTTYKQFKHDFLKPIAVSYINAFDLFMHLTVCWMMSSELISVLELSGAQQSFKLALSIFWGIYALFIISLGIWKNKKHLRIGAIILFSITLLKLFLYDISHLNTISKTIVFVSLGILLLLISFLYNKYKHLIVQESEV